MRPVLPLLLTLLLCLPLSARAFDDGVDSLKFSAPDGFTELTDRESDLFLDTEKNAVRHGRLVKMYLPQYMAHQYRYGSRDAVTRQVLICAMEGQNRPPGSEGRRTAGPLHGRTFHRLFAHTAQPHRHPGAGAGKPSEGPRTRALHGHAPAGGFRAHVERVSVHQSHPL